MPLELQYVGPKVPRGKTMRRPVLGPGQWSLNNYPRMAAMIKCVCGYSYALGKDEVSAEGFVVDPSIKCCDQMIGARLLDWPQKLEAQMPVEEEEIGQHAKCAAEIKRLVGALIEARAIIVHISVCEVEPEEIEQALKAIDAALTPKGGGG